jgi:hypothetical protein
MSRSYKKTPGWCDRNPHAKRQANKRVRRTRGPIPDGRWYRKLYCSWNICDWRIIRIRACWRRWPTINRQPDWRARMK